MPTPAIPRPESPIVAIVDDDDSVREALCELLAVMGIRCRGFDRAETLLMDYRVGAFDCLITDVRMPGMSGLELQERLSASDPQMPVIFISADASAAARARALARGAYAYLAKPVSEEVLLEHLRAVLGRGPSSDKTEPADE